MKILFICDFGRPFSGIDFHTTGVGGTEAGVVVLAEHLAKCGHLVIVANTISIGQLHNGVAYSPLGNNSTESYDLTILVKKWSDLAQSVTSGKKVFFWTDVHIVDTAMVKKCLNWSHRVLLMSEFQKQCLLRALPSLNSDRIHVVGLPVNISDYQTYNMVRDNLLIYCSVPDRGLLYLRHIFPHIRKRIPDAQLVITSDFTLWGLPAAKSTFEKFFGDMPGILYLGAVSRTELVDWQSRSKIMAYPCRFEEGFCIAAAECMAAGAVPITTNDFALTTTVGSSGVLINGRPRSCLYQRQFIRSAVSLLSHDEEWSKRSFAAREDALQRFAPTQLVTNIIEQAFRE